jgi:hypothetical protein
MQREQQQATKAEGEGQRRRAHEDVVRRGAQYMGRPADAGRDHVAVEVHGRLGLAGGARGEGEDAGVVARGVDVGEFGGLLRHRRFEAIGRGIVEPADVPQFRRLLWRFGGGQLEFFGQANVAQGMRDLRLGDHVLEFLGAQQRHGRRGDSADFHHREPAGGHHRVVRRAQEHAIAGDDAELIDQHVGDAVGLLLQVGVGPAQLGRLDADPPSPAFRDVPVEQFRRAVHALGKLQLRQVETGTPAAPRAAAGCRG